MNTCDHCETPVDTDGLNHFDAGELGYTVETQYDGLALCHHCTSDAYGEAERLSSVDGSLEAEVLAERQRLADAVHDIIMGGARIAITVHDADLAAAVTLCERVGGGKDATVRRGSDWDFTAISPRLKHFGPEDAHPLSFFVRDDR